MDTACEARNQPPLLRMNVDCFDALDVVARQAAYRTAEPFPHIAMDGLLPGELLKEVVREIDALEVEPEKDFYSTFKKRRISDFVRLPPTTQQLVADLNSAPFLDFLERLTGVEGLIPDPFLEGGGVHQIGPGGFLKIHTDFNFHAKLNLHRRLNLLLYLNPVWDEEWGGALELWNEKVDACVARYLPEFNRMIIFSTTDASYHGHPDPLACPSNVRRNSIALYYYTADRPASEVRFDRSTMTNYQLRPKEKFSHGRLHHLVNQLEIRVPAFRSMMTRLRHMR